MNSTLRTNELIGIIRGLLKLVDQFHVETYGAGNKSSPWLEQVEARDVINEWQKQNLPISAEGLDEPVKAFTALKNKWLIAEKRCDMNDEMDRLEQTIERQNLVNSQLLEACQKAISYEQSGRGQPKDWLACCSIAITQAGTQGGH